jgi:heat shock protein HslJ
MRRARANSVAIGRLALAVALAACAGRSAASRGPVTLAGSEWLLIDVGGRPAVAGVRATLVFVDSASVAGNATCNDFDGPLELDGERVVRAGPFASTRRACVDAVLAEQESRYLQALRGAERVWLAGPELLVDVRGVAQPLRFRRLPARRR